jgi:hypothetical protein
MLPGGGRALLLGTIWYFLINTIMFISATVTVQLDYKRILQLEGRKKQVASRYKPKGGREEFNEPGWRTILRWLHVSMAFLASGKGGSSLSK